MRYVQYANVKPKEFQTVQLKWHESDLVQLEEDGWSCAVEYKFSWVVRIEGQQLGSTGGKSKRVLAYYRWTPCGTEIRGRHNFMKRLDRYGYANLKKSGELGQKFGSEGYSEICQAYRHWLESGEPDEFEYLS